MVDKIHLKGNKFVMGMKVRATVDSKLMTTLIAIDRLCYLVSIESYQFIVLTLRFDWSVLF